MKDVVALSSGILLFLLLHPSQSRPSAPPLFWSRQYEQRPPYNPALYHTLHVPSNATAQQIQRSYRTLSRQYHPDKQPQAISPGTAARLSEVRAAYEILRHPRPRWLYHRHGVILSPSYPRDVLHILYPSSGAAATTPGPYDAAAVRTLHQWMGWSLDDDDDIEPTKEERIHNVLLHLVEQMRPILEAPPFYTNTTMQHVLTHWAQMCDRTKYLPFGAGILRCIGRAYQYEGRLVLLREWRARKLRTALRQLGHWSHAALAGSRVLLPRGAMAWTSRRDPQAADVLLPCGNDETDEMATAYWESMQMEALWKVYKMELDDIIRQACRQLLDGRGQALLPSHATSSLSLPRGSAEMIHGYIPSSRGAHTKDDGVHVVWTTQSSSVRTSMATILVRMGQVMVERSKVGTAWRA